MNNCANSFLFSSFYYNNNNDRKKKQNRINNFTLAQIKVSTQTYISIYG